MFTGIIEALGTLDAVEACDGDCHLRISAPGYFAGSGLGDSVAVNGICLTAVALDADHFSADLSAETLSLTTAARWQVGDRVNLERALTAGKALGGHLVSGHVDGVGQLLSRSEDARSIRLEFTVPATLARYIARKGSICIDGVSLTVNDVRDGAQATVFGVNIVPHTAQHTTLGALSVGAAVNIEVDLIARHLERLLEGRLLGGREETTGS